LPAKTAYPRIDKPQSRVTVRIEASLGELWGENLGVIPNSMLRQGRSFIKVIVQFNGYVKPKAVVRNLEQK
jgi:hypothetical protein